MNPSGDIKPKSAGTETIVDPKIELTVENAPELEALPFFLSLMQYRATNLDQDVIASFIIGSVGVLKGEKGDKRISACLIYQHAT